MKVLQDNIKWRKPIAGLALAKNHHTTHEDGGSDEVALDITELTDVTITTPADNEVLAYDTTSGDWLNQTPDEANLADLSTAQTIGGAKKFTSDVTLDTTAKLTFDDASTVTTTRILLETGYYLEMYFA